MKKVLLNLSIIVLATFFYGCASVSKKNGTPVRPAPPPKPVHLSALPDYGADKSVNADKSSGCYLLPRIGYEYDSVTATFQDLLVQGLKSRGYTVIEDYKTAEARNDIRKQLMLVDYSTRTQYLPVRKKTANDIHVVLKVQNRPGFAAAEVDARYFSVIARSIRAEADPSLSAALQSTVDNFFCLDTFCGALSSKSN